MSAPSSEIWRPGDQVSPHDASNTNIHSPEVFATIERGIDSLDKELRELTHPELKFEEHHAHNVLTAFMEKQGFEVTQHYLMPTAWVAKFTHGTGGRVIGVNSEMDALPGVGHACGHNLIAIAGVAVACGIKYTLEERDISGTVVLLGTPGEEGGGGKVILLEKGAYEGMDACLIAHAALAPWEGQNALDAAVSAYNSIAMLRQQMKPSHRIHGIFEGKDWAANIIPDYAKML
ncbi:hypothetical protein PHLCEN_2v8904 [Hermanssonia centrifuga]|uniref:Amidohydrolase n=1 Tax=Hermanssonia centrifuga TaxID=98765 RepID=A0A2R6NSD3_9APHY|nr:hypothetical protein PHLCEN_2v8904 [Hermanssonia centrifuga]